MDIFQIFWHDFLYRPLFNLLIYLYQFNNAYNLGLAVIYLTIILRILLLPFSFFNQRNQARHEQLSKEVAKINENFKHDPQKAREEVRKVLKKYKIRPWAKAIVLGVQALVLVVLYQVFMGGINNKLNALYSFVPAPDFINVYFLGINLGKHNIWLASLVGFILYLEIYFSQRKVKNMLTKSDIIYRYCFPLFSAIALALLPAVKSIFILTSIFFTIIVTIVFKLFFGGKYKLE